MPLNAATIVRMLASLRSSRSPFARLGSDVLVATPSLLCDAAIGLDAVFGDMSNAGVSMWRGGKEVWWGCGGALVFPFFFPVGTRIAFAVAVESATTASA